MMRHVRRFGRPCKIVSSDRPTVLFVSIIVVFYDDAVAANGYAGLIKPSPPHNGRHRASQVKSNRWIYLKVSRKKFWCRSTPPDGRSFSCSGLSHLWPAISGSLFCYRAAFLACGACIFFAIQNAPSKSHSESNFVADSRYL